MSQQQVAKHLQIMENAGIVSSTSNSGISGPKRRVFRLNKSFSIVLDVAPHLYNEKVVAFDVGLDKMISEDSVSFMDRMNDILDYPGGKDRIEPLAKMSHLIADPVHPLFWIPVPAVKIPCFCILSN